MSTDTFEIIPAPMLQGEGLRASTSVMKPADALEAWILKTNAGEVLGYLSFHGGDGDSRMITKLRFYRFLATMVKDSPRRYELTLSGNPVKPGPMRSFLRRIRAGVAADDPALDTVVVDLAPEIYD